MNYLITLLLLSTLGFSETIKIDYTKSSIHFQVSNMWLNHVNGSFRRFKATINYDTKSHFITSCKATVPVASIFTDNETRDKELLAPDYFNAAYYPQMSFEMNEIFNNYIVGYLTILDKTRPVSLHMNKFEIKGKDVTLELEGDLERDEFGITTGSYFMIGKMVQFTISIKGTLDGETKAH